MFYSLLRVNGGWEPSAVAEELILSPLLSLAFPARFDLSHVRFFIYSGAWFWIFLLLFLHPSCRYPLCAANPMNLGGDPCLYPHPAVGWKLNLCRLSSCASLPGRIITALPSVFQGFDWANVCCGGVLLGVCTRFPFGLPTEFFTRG